MIRAIKRWYEGEAKMTKGYNGPGIVMIPAPYTEYHWTARAARSLVSFYLRHWQWIGGSAIALLGIYVAYLAIPASR
jgi:hypothetical protein